MKLAVDLVIVSFSFLIASSIARKRAFPNEGFFVFDKWEITFLAALCIVWYLSSKATGLYDEFRSRTVGFELLSSLKNCIVQLMVSVAFIFIIKTTVLSRFFILLNFLFQLLLLIFIKIIMRAYLQWLRTKGHYVSSLLIIGAGKLGRDFFGATRSCPNLGYEVRGFLDDVPQPDLGNLYLGSIDELDDILERQKVDEVIIALPNYAVDRIEKTISVCEMRAISPRIVPDYYKFLRHKFTIILLGNFPIISLKNALEEIHWRILKRMFDTIFTAAIFLFVFIWLWPIIAIAIKMSSPGPIFFKQERWGRRNQRIICYKFRSMVRDSKDLDEKGNFQQASRDDPRVTRVGKFMRKTSLDELPQFLNVLKGEISIVGPRPHPTPLNLDSKNKIKHYMLRHLVKPGITGWAQVNGYRGETRDPTLMQKRIEYDLWYIENWSFLLDLQIILLTIKGLFKIDPSAF